MVVDESGVGIRIDKYLSSNTSYSRNTILGMIENGYILVNNLVVKPSYKLKLKDNIFIKDGYIKDVTVEKKDIPLDIVYEDNDIIIINKPSGLVVHPGNGNYNNTLVNGLLYYTDNLSNNNGLERVGIVHRIDKDTSGLILACKNNKAHEVMALEFKNHTIKRTYIALLEGVLPHNKVTVDAPIGRDVNNRLKMAVTNKNSKNAITHIEVIKRYKNYTLVKCLLETGRTHQIRVHTKYIGYPVFNDPVYSNKPCTEFGQFLHSYSMEFNHPITKKHLYFECPLPKDFQDFLNKLEIEENS